MLTSNLFLFICVLFPFICCMNVGIFLSCMNVGFSPSFHLCSILLSFYVSIFPSFLVCVIFYLHLFYKCWYFIYYIIYECWYILFICCFKIAYFTSFSIPLTSIGNSIPFSVSVLVISFHLLQEYW